MLQLPDRVQIVHWIGRIGCKPKLFYAARGCTKRGFSAIVQAHGFAGNQFKNVAPAKTPTATDAIAGDHTALGQLVHGFKVDLKQRRYF